MSNLFESAGIDIGLIVLLLIVLVVIFSGYYGEHVGQAEQADKKVPAVYEGKGRTVHGKSFCSEIPGNGKTF